MSINSFREWVNLRLFGSKQAVLLMFSGLSIAVAILSFALIVYIVGFPPSHETNYIQMILLKSIFGFYMLNFFVRFLYTFEPRKFFKQTRLEWILLLLILIEALSTLLFNFPIGENILSAILGHHSIRLYLFLLLTFLLTLFIINFAKASTFFEFLTLHPSTLFILSFILLISIGTGALMLPAMHYGPPSFIISLFTSTSACCVTGLTVVDTATYFTLKGKIAIMILIQLGGLSIISFATFFASLFNKGLGLKHTSLMADYYSTDSILSAKSLLRQIIITSLLIESVASVLLFIEFGYYADFPSFKSQLFTAVFHSVSAFNNAGFSTYSGNLYEPVIRHAVALHLTIGAVIFFGSLGFSTIQELFNPSYIRERRKSKWRKISISSKIALYSSLWLIAIGSAIFFFYERDNALAEFTFAEKIGESIFMGITPRTAGFNSMDYGVVKIPTLIVTIFLMFVGASSGSTGGGIKTSTFTLLFVSAWASVRGQKNIELFKHSIAWELLNKAFSILLFSATFCLACWLALCTIDPGIDPMKLLFEEVSAFGTVGLSTGITASLSQASKYIIIVSMFVGRVGTITLALALSSQVTSTRYKYPGAHFMVG
ncbi:MAG: ATPase [Bacteroidetes bacterium]|nr:ATPase [Bacteroidota bacterium]